MVGKPAAISAFLMSHISLFLTFLVCSGAGAMIDMMFESIVFTLRLALYWLQSKGLLPS